MIDGGKGQLAAALAARDQAGYKAIPAIGLAKRFEEIILKHEAEFRVMRLPQNSHLVKLLQRIRDESHRFAVSYHSTLRRTRQTASVLDGVPGVGPITRKKLIRHFGSARSVLDAPAGELQKVLGDKTGVAVARYLKSLK